MPTDHGITVTAIYSAAPAIFAAAAAEAFAVPVNEYATATMFSLIGLVARHCYDASKTGTFNLKGLAFDVPTAPMLGIVAYIGCLYFNIEPLITPGLVILISFLGPDWLRTLGSGLADVVIGRLKGKSG